MLSVFRQPSRSAGMAVGYITAGSLAMIWAAIWFWYMNNPSHDWRIYVCTGLFASGLDVALIGFFLGRIGQSAKDADHETPVATGTPQQVVPQMPVQQAVPQQVMLPANNGTVPQGVPTTTVNT